MPDPARSRGRSSFSAGLRRRSLASAPPRAGNFSGGPGGCHMRPRTNDQQKWAPVLRKSNQACADCAVLICGSARQLITGRMICIDETGSHLPDHALKKPHESLSPSHDRHRHPRPGRSRNPGSGGTSGTAARAGRDSGESRRRGREPSRRDAAPGPLSAAEGRARHSRARDRRRGGGARRQRHALEARRQGHGAGGRRRLCGILPRA